MRLTDNEIQNIFEELALPDPARDFIQAIRAGEPVRRSNRRLNITGRFPSVKMGKTIQYESRSGEGLACLFYESDDAVLEFYDQPHCFRVPYTQPGVSGTHVEHTPDFLVIRRVARAVGSFTHSITFEEWREEARMENFAQGDPKRWLRLLTGDWTQTPVEEHLRTLALDYRIRIIDTTPAILARNYELLSDHFLAPQPLDPALLNETQALIGSKLGISRADAQAALPQLDADALFAMIAQGKVFANLRQALLTSAAAVRLYLDPQLHALLDGPAQPVERGEVNIEAGAHLRLGEEEFEILSVGTEKVFMTAASDGRSREVLLSDFMRLAEAGDIVGISNGRADIASALVDKDPSVVLLARQRLKVIEPYLREGTYPLNRTHQRWIAEYKRGEELHGEGFIGLVPDFQERGYRTPRLKEATEEIAAKVIREQLLRPDRLSLRKAHALFQLECEQAGQDDMALSSFHERYRLISHAERLRARVGARAANGAAMKSGRGGMYLPPHGDRALGKVDIDHTTLDIFLRDSGSDAVLGKPECTLVVDSFSRRILVALVLFQKPSAETDMLALRELVRNYHQMPTTIMVDGGSDFTSTYFEALCAALRTKVQHRRIGHARDGGLVEAAFGQLNDDLIHVLTGNSQNLKNPRAMSREFSPVKRAIWTLSALQEELDRYVEFKNEQPVRTLGGSPREIFEKSMADAGPRRFRRIAFNTAFRALTAHQPKNGGAAKVGRDGVRINNLQYWCEAFRQPGVEGTKVSVRYEPLDGRVAYARVNKVWHVAHAEYPELEGRTEKQIAVASQELRRRLGQEPSMHELAVYLKQVQAREAGLKGDQALRERRAAEQSQVVGGRDTLDEQPTSAPVPVEPANSVETTEQLEELSGYEQHTAEELRDLLGEASETTEEAA